MPSELKMVRVSNVTLLMKVTMKIFKTTIENKKAIIMQKKCFKKNRSRSQRRENSEKKEENVQEETKATNTQNNSNLKLEIAHRNDQLKKK